MNLLDTPLDNTNVFIRSSDYTSAVNSTKSDLIFELNRPIRIHNNMDMLVSLESFNFTNSFYVINDYNRYFYYSTNSLGNAYVAVTLDKGNYDVSSFLYYINTALASVGFVFTYKSSTMKITITNPTPFRLVNPTNNMFNIYELLGFNDYGTTSLSTSITSPFVVNFCSTQVLHIVISNLPLDSIGLKNKSKMNVINSIPIETLPGEVQSYKNPSNFKYKIADTLITFLNIRILDQDYNLVDFNNIDWFMSLSFQPIYRPELRNPDKYLLDETPSLEYEEYLKQEEERNLLRDLAIYFQRKKYTD